MSQDSGLGSRAWLSLPILSRLGLRWAQPTSGVAQMPRSGKPFRIPDA